jgi:hypothetical protein
MSDKKETKEIVHAIPQSLLDHVVANYKKPADLIGENGLLKQLTKAVIEAALNAEMGQHLGHDRHALAGSATGNVSRRGPIKLWFMFGVGLVLVTLSLAGFVLRMIGRVSTEGMHVALVPTYDKIPGVFDPCQRVMERPRAELAHRISINSLGFRGEQVTLEKAPEKFRILCSRGFFCVREFRKRRGHVSALAR